MPRVNFSILFACSAWFFAAPAQSLCPNIKEDIAHTFPGIPNHQHSFQADIEINQVLLNRTAEMKVYYDSKMNQETNLYLAPSKEGNKQLRTIFNYKERQVYVIKDGYDCRTFNITSDVSDGPVENPIANSTIFSIAGLMRSLHDLKTGFVDDKQRVRGIEADHFRGCKDDTKTNITRIVDYYFSVENWARPVTIGSVLLRLVISDINDDGSKQLDNTYIDFLSLRPLVLDPEHKVFQIPADVYCKGEVSSKDVPRLPEQLTFRLEFTLTTLHASFKMVEYRDVWYSYPMGLVRLNHRTYEKGISKDNNPVTEVHDYNTGVKYVIDKINGDCTVSGMSNSSADVAWDASQVDKDNAHVVRLKNPMEMFFLTKDYIYVGQSTVRGIHCDVFISQMAYPPAGPTPSNVEYYFSADYWFMGTNLGEKPSEGVPIMLKITNQKNGYAAEYHFYDFSTNSLMLDVFGISSCYPEVAKKHVTVGFPGPYYNTVEKMIPDFLDHARMSFALSGKVSPIRIQNMDLDYFPETNTISVSFIMLDVAPRDAQFGSPEAKQHISEPHLVKPDVYNVDDCMEYCLEEPGIVCNSFDYCGDKCNTYTTHGGTKDLIDSTQCKHYNRIVNGLLFVEQGLHDAWQDLRSDVYEGSVEVSVMLKDDQKSYVAVSIRDDKIQDGNYEPDDSMSRFDRFKKKAMLLPSQARPFAVKTSVDECAMLCLKEKDFQCSSFSYCHYATVTNMCLISSSHPEVDKNIVKEQNDCNIYSRHYLDDYTKYEGASALTIDKTYPSCKKSAMECATECSQSNKLDCKSFFYCLTNGMEDPTCFISDRRTPGISDPAYGESHKCQFFTKKYFDDFAKIGKPRLISVTDGVLYGDISIEECMTRCFQKFGGEKCTSVEYCKEEQPPLCFLPVEGYNYTGIGKMEAKCQRYGRNVTTDHISAGDSPHADQQTSPDKESGGYTSTAMGALAMGTLILGAIVGAVLFWALSKTRSRPNPPEDRANLPSTMEMTNA